jgi:hypothetical protein
MKTASLLALGALSLAIPLTARAQTNDPLAVEAHPHVAAGFAFPLVGYEAYGFGVDVRIGVDLVFEHDLSQLLAVEVGWAALAVSGARMDLLPITLGWRWVPVPDVGFYTLVAGGAGLAVDTLDAQLGARGLAVQSVRAAGFATVGIGFTLFAHIDLEILYRQALIVGEVVDPLGTIGARLGGRL